MTFQEEFRKQFSELVWNRIDNVIVEHAYKDDEYKNSSEQASQLFRRIEKILGEEFKDLIHEFDTAKNTMLAVESEYIYKHGFRDGTQLKQELWLAN